MFMCIHIHIYIYIYIRIGGGEPAQGVSQARSLTFVLRAFCGSFAENCGELRRLSFPNVKWPTRIAEICGDDESAQKLRRQISKSWLVKFPKPADYIGSSQEFRDVVFEDVGLEHNGLLTLDN